MRQWRWITGTALALAIAACGGSSDGGSGLTTQPGNGNGGGTTSGGTSSTNTITLQDQSFTPSSITVPKGTTVVFAWPTCDSGSSGGYGGYGACITHDVVFDDGSNIDSGAMSSGTFTRTFTTTGTFKFHCSIHGANVMSGSVTVQ